MGSLVTGAQLRGEALGAVPGGKTFPAKHAKFETGHQAKRDRGERTRSDTGRLSPKLHTDSPLKHLGV